MKKVINRLLHHNNPLIAVHYAILAALLILTCYICFYKLGNAPFEDWDEAWYGEMGKQILKTGEWGVLKWNGNFLFDKPPLSIWLGTIISLFIGFNELSFRIPSAISGFVIIVSVTFFIYKRWGIVPGILGYCSLAFNDVFIWRVRSGNMDALLTLFVVLSFFLIIYRWKYRYIALGIVFAGIFLTKLSVVALPISVFLLYEVAFNYKETKKTPLKVMQTLLISGAIIGVWLVYGAIKTHIGFITYYLLNSDQKVSHVSLADFKTDYIQYTYYSLQRRFLYVMILGTIAAFFKWKNGMFVITVIFAYSLILLLSFTERKNNWYLLPAMPFWSVLVGYGTYIFMEKIKILKIFLAFGVLLLTFYVSYKTFTGHIIPIVNSSPNAKHIETARKMKELSSENETIIRMDHLYPSTVFYSDRHTLASLPYAGDSNIFISYDSLAKKLQNKELRWLIGKKGDIESFVNERKIKGIYIRVNDEEYIFKSTSL